MDNRADIVALEKRGEHKLVDLLLAAVVGDYRKNLEPIELRRSWPSTNPSDEGDEPGIKPWDWVKREAQPPPDLDMMRRIVQDEPTTVAATEWNPGVEAIPASLMVELGGCGFISPSGKCYQAGYSSHEMWLSQRMKENPIDLEINGANWQEEKWPYKATLQKQGWVAYHSGEFMVLREGDTHSSAKPENLTPQQMDVAREVFNIIGANKFKLGNPYLYDAIVS